MVWAVQCCMIRWLKNYILSSNNFTLHFQDQDKLKAGSPSVSEDGRKTRSAFPEQSKVQYEQLLLKIFTPMMQVSRKDHFVATDGKETNTCSCWLPAQWTGGLSNSWDQSGSGLQWSPALPFPHCKTDKVNQKFPSVWKHGAGVAILTVRTANCVLIFSLNSRNW